jgi:hypothetical protein
MHQSLPCNQSQLIFADFLNTVPHNALNALSVLYKIEFKTVMAVDGIQEFALVAVHNIKTILVRNGRTFPEHATHKFILFCKDNIISTFSYQG